MKNIQPVTIWKEGEVKQANILGLIIINDNLSSSATFYYQLLHIIEMAEGENDIVEGLAEGNLVIDGADYLNWGEFGDTNEEAYQFCAAKLGLTII